MNTVSPGIAVSSDGGSLAVVDVSGGEGLFKEVFAPLLLGPYVPLASGQLSIHHNLE